MKKMPQPIPYQGSKRKIARQILAYFPDHASTLVEPFAGFESLYLSDALMARLNHLFESVKKGKKYNE